jgi:hypothetical protein
MIRAPLKCSGRGGARLAGFLLVIATTAAWAATPARAGWRASAETRASVAYNNGITFDPLRREFFFDGVTSTTNSGLYRTDSRLVQMGANGSVIPPSREGYNHIGDLSFDPVLRRMLLPMECYYPSSGGDTCGVGAIGVADPITLRFSYYVNLAPAQIKKAMWAEVSPDGRWIWTSSGTHLLVYRAADVNHDTAEHQRAGKIGGIVGRDLGSVLPTSSVTGATFYQDALTRVPRLLLALNRGTYSEVVSYPTTSGDRWPKLLSSVPTSEITVARSDVDNESEGLAITGPTKSPSPLGGVLHWQMLPLITGSSLYSRILNYMPIPAPPYDAANVQLGQRLQTALSDGLRLNVICNHTCTPDAVATINGKLARRLGLTSSGSVLRPYVVGTGSLRPGAGIRTLRITFRARPRAVLRCQSKLTLAIAVRLLDPNSRQAATFRLSTTLRGVSACRPHTRPPSGDRTDHRKGTFSWWMPPGSARPLGPRTAR